MTATDRRKPARHPEALERRRRAIVSEVICWRRALRWVSVVVGVLVIAVILVATLH